MPITPVEIGAEKTTLVLIKNADVVRLLNDTLDTSRTMAIPRESDEGPQTRQGMLNEAIGAFSGVPITPTPGPPTLLGSPESAAMGPALMRSMRVELAMPSTGSDYTGPVSGAEVSAEWYEPAYEALAEHGVSPGVRIETDAVQVTITSRTEGAIIGSFTADFDRGSQNTDAMFRGRIEGKFSMGILRDETAGDEQPPEDFTAFLTTDYFIGLARTGMNTGDIGAMLRAQGNELSTSSSGGPPAAGSSSGASGGQGSACRVSRAEFETWFQETYGQVSGLTPSEMREIHDQLLENWTFTEPMICNMMGRS